MSLATLLLAVAPLLTAQGKQDQNAEQLLKAATTAFIDGNVLEALALADKAIRLDPKNPRAYLLRGTLHDSAERHAAALADFTETIRLNPKEADAYDRRGSVHFKLGKFAESVRDFDKYLELVPEARKSHWRRGISCYYAKQYDQGRKQFEAYEKVDTNDVENAVWRYLCMVPAVGVEKARAVMLKIGRDKRVPMMEVYELFRGKLKPAEVLAAVERGEPSAEQRKSRLFYAHLYLGLYYESLGDGKRALEHLSTAAKHRIGHYMWDVARVARNTLLQSTKK